MLKLHNGCDASGRLMKLITCFLVFLTSIAVSTGSYSQTDKKIAVLYPEVSRPYSVVFDQIINGIEDHAGISVAKYSVTENNNPSEIDEWLVNQKPDILIALGRRGTELIQKIQTKLPTVIGGILHTNDPNIDELPGISLTPDPALLFDRLKIFSPNTKRIHVVYNPDNYSWLIKAAQKAADNRGLILVAKPATNLRQSALAHKDIMEDIDSANDSVWLLQDPTTVGMESILPYILKEAWEKKLLIFSSSPEHVARGVLFSLYADNTGLGNNLVNLALQISEEKPNIKHELLPLKSVRIAVNIRTAGHIGLRIPFEEQRNFDLVFPRR